MQRKFYKRNNKKFYNPSKKIYKKGDYNKNIKRKSHFDGRSSETRLIIDRFLEKETPYIRYDLQDILYDEEFIKKMDLYQECRILRLGCQLQPLNNKGVISVYYDDLCNDQQVRHVVYPVSKVINLSWYNIGKNVFDSTFKFGKLCFVNKNRLRFKCQIRIVIIFQGKKSDELKGVNWDDVTFSKNSSVSSITKESQSTSSDKNSLNSLVNSISKAKTSFEPSGDLNMVLDNNSINDFSKLMANRFFRSYEEFLDSYYLKRRKAKNLYDKEKKKFNKLAGQLKDVNVAMKNDIELIKSGLIENKVEEHVKNLKGTIALVNNKIKQYDEKMNEYSNTDSNIKTMRMAINQLLQNMVKTQKVIAQLTKECRDNSNKINILNDIKKDDDDYDYESDFLSSAGSIIIKKKNIDELFDTYDEADLYMKDKYKKAKERRLHKVVYDNLLHKYKIV